MYLVALPNEAALPQVAWSSVVSLVICVTLSLLQFVVPVQPLFTGAGLSISLSKDSPKEITLLESIACCAWEPQLVPWYLFQIIQCVLL